MKKKLLTTMLFLSGAILSRANIITVPTDYGTLQTAIDSSADGDTVVALPGTYYENINFRGKKIMLTSLFYLSNDTTFISSTIINGSQPLQADTGSCVLIISGEDSTTVLQGFTITGGSGTKWLDEHGAGTYREGGGILIQYSSPVIRYNVIINNSATNTTGVSGAGGGGLRIGDCNPKILNNVISYNQGRYGPGIVLNYTGCVIKNNLIAYNFGGQSYNGGGAVWANSNPLSGNPKIIENNTIFSNHATTGTGGILSMGSSVIVRNNILWRNTSPNNSQVFTAGGTATVTYSDVQGGYTGSGNINIDPLFVDTASFYLMALSPCIDAGDSSAIYNDIENISLPGFALLPSLGTIRNDMGAYGGQGAALLGNGQVTGIGTLDFYALNEIKISPNPAFEKFTVYGLQPTVRKIEMFNTIGKKVLERNLKNKSEIQIDTRNFPKGIYFVKLTSENNIASRKIVLQ
jgi:hypothetical protein